MSSPFNNPKQISRFTRTVRILAGLVISAFPLVAIGLIVLVLTFTVQHWIKYPLMIALSILGVWLARGLFMIIQKIGWIGLYAGQWHTPEFPPDAKDSEEESPNEK